MLRVKKQGRSSWQHVPYQFTVVHKHSWILECCSFWMNVPILSLCAEIHKWGSKTWIHMTMARRDLFFFHPTLPFQFLSCSQVGWQDSWLFIYFSFWLNIWSKNFSPAKAHSAYFILSVRQPKTDGKGHFICTPCRNCSSTGHNDLAKLKVNKSPLARSPCHVAKSSTWHQVLPVLPVCRFVTAFVFHLPLQCTLDNLKAFIYVCKCRCHSFT